MATYTMTPYAFSLAPRYARGGERRPIADLNGRGLTLRSILDKKLESYKGDELIIDAEDASRSLRVRRFYPIGNFTFVEFGLGRGGVVGMLHKKTGERTAYAGDDHNETVVRGIFVYPESSHEAFWLSERAGNITAYSHLYKVLKQAARDVVPDLTPKLDVVADWAAVKSWAAQVAVKELRFDAPRMGTSSQAMDVNGLHGDIRITIKPRGVKLDRLVKDTGPDAEAVFGFLSSAPLVRESNISTESIVGQGWGAKVAFENKAGRQRSFGLSLDEDGPTLIYPVGHAPDTDRNSSTGLSQAYVPSDSEFRAACAEFLEDISARLGVGASVANDILAQN